MSRIKNWTDRDTQEREADLHIMYDRGISADVYRTTDNHTNTGFSDELNEQTFIKTINVRLDPSDKQGFDWYGLTDDIDVQVNDLWRVTDLTDTAYKVRVETVIPRAIGADVRLKNVAN